LSASDPSKQRRCVRYAEGTPWALEPTADDVRGRRSRCNDAVTHRGDRGGGGGGSAGLYSIGEEDEEEHYHTGLLDAA